MSPRSRTIGINPSTNAAADVTFYPLRHLVPSSPRQLRLCLICVAVLNRCDYYYITKLRSNHRASSFNSLSDSHLHYTVTHGARSTLRALAVPGRRVPSRYPIPRREACSNPGLTITRQLTIWAHRHRDLAPPLPVSGRFSFAANRPAHALTRPLRLPRSF